MAEDEKTEGTSPAAATEGVTPDAIGERIDAAVEDGVDVPVPTVEAAVETPSDPEIGAEIDAAVETAAADEPAETRMGSGKGSPEFWVAVVRPGRVMFELAGVPEPLAREAMRLAAMKLPIKCKVVAREGDLFEG